MKQHDFGKCKSQSGKIVVVIGNGLCLRKRPNFCLENGSARIRSHWKQVVVGKKIRFKHSLPDMFQRPAALLK